MSARHPANWAIPFTIVKPLIDALLVEYMSLMALEPCNFVFFVKLCEANDTVGDFLLLLLPVLFIFANLFFFLISLLLSH